MKRNILVILYTVSLFFISDTFAQNIPNAATAPSGPTSTLISLPQAYNNTSYNYTRTWVPTTPITVLPNLDIHAPDNYSVLTKYVNGWGQTLQTTLRGGANTKDKISIGDNRTSLTTTTFLPYVANKFSLFQNSPFLDQKNYYLGNTMFPAEEGTSYVQTKYSNANGVPAQTAFAAGKSFVGHNVGLSSDVSLNKYHDIINFTLLNGTPYNNGYYDINQLNVNKVAGQHNEQLRIVYDKSERLICKQTLTGYHIDTVVESASWYDANGMMHTDYTTSYVHVDEWLSTYYVYNDLGQLVYILPPKAMKIGVFTSEVLNNLCFKYVYNKYGKIIEKNIPGKNGREYIVYDKKQRPVMMQTPLLSSQTKWEYYIYDSRGNIAFSGLLNSSNSQSYWQNQVDNTPNPTQGTILDYLVHGFTGNYPFTIPNCEINQVNYYDNYQHFALVNNAFNTSFSANYVPTIDAEIPEPSYVTQGLLTGSQTRVLDDNNPNTYITNVYYYDKKGRLIQTQTQNKWSPNDWDIYTNQYNFNGLKMLEIGNMFMQTSTTKPSTLILKRYSYDMYNANRLWNISEKIDNNPWETIALYTYDDFGRMSKKVMGGVEAQEYNYNIRGQLAGINSQYTSTGYNPNNDKTFGCILNYDYGFNTPRLDGKISGIKWRGAGYSPMKAYGYEFDTAGRLHHAEFRELTDPVDPTVLLPLNPTWNKTFQDYTASNFHYDVNGNLFSMDQKGVGLVNNAFQIVDIDKLHYEYFKNSNRLKQVADEITTDYNLGDFVDGACNTPDITNAEGNPSNPQQLLENPNNPTLSVLNQERYQTNYQMPDCQDYYYDADGNLKKDFNKGITEITYNHFDLPVKTTVDNAVTNVTGSISNIYDGNGTILEKTIVEGNQTNNYKYLGPLVYLNDDLLYIVHDEGRIRYVTDSQVCHYDYYVKDHLGNVRNVVTSHVSNPVIYVASHEIAAANLEASIFDNIPKVRSDNPNPEPSNTKAIELYGDDETKRIGTAILLKVMAGDKFDISAKSLFNEELAEQTYTSASSVLFSLFKILSTGVNPVGGSEGRDIQAIFNSFDPDNFSAAYQSLLDANIDSTLPAGFLNYIAFDEQMNMLTDQSTALQMQGPAGDWQDISANNLNVNVNGYVLVFLSNMASHHVFFDQLKIKTYSGKLVQEQHYYPFGLPVNMGQGPGLTNKFLFEGNELQDNVGVRLSDFNFRQYDQQIGRFWGVDLLADDAQESLSPYHFTSNDPANFTDPMGLSAPGYFVYITHDGDDDVPHEDGHYEYVQGTGDGASPWLGTGGGGNAASGGGASGIGGGGFMAKTNPKPFAASPMPWASTDIFPKVKPGVQTVNAGTGSTDIIKQGEDQSIWRSHFGSLAHQGIIAVNKTVGYGGNLIYGAVYGEDGWTHEKVDKVAAGMEYAGFVLLGGISEGTAPEISHLVYQGVDKKGVVRYIGRTCVTPSTKRFVQHLAAEGTGKEFLRYSVVADNLTYNQARKMEQTLINQFGLGKNGGTLLNKINSISQKFWSPFGIH